MPKNSGGFSYFLIGLNDLLNGEISPHRYAAKGKVKAAVTSPDGKTIDVRIVVAPGWHINSDKPLQDYLIPTKLSQVNDTPLEQLSYPNAVVRKLGFQQSSLSLYEGSIEMSGVVPEEVSRGSGVQIELQLQACSDEICLAPETLLFNVPLTQTTPSF